MIETEQSDTANVTEVAPQRVHHWWEALADEGPYPGQPSLCGLALAPDRSIPECLVATRNSCVVCVEVARERGYRV